MDGDGWLAILHPFQQYFIHIRTMGGDNIEMLCAMEKISPQVGLEPGTASSAGQCLTH